MPPKSDALALIGNTPLMELSRYAASRSLPARILAKLEFFNPFGSVKDRIGLGMIEAAEKDGRLRPGSVIIEPTSGNTGIGLSAAAIIKGYRVILTMPETMSVERRQLLAAHGAELELTEGAKGMAGAIEKARELAASIPNSFIPGQFDNPANPETHYRSTGPEIWRDTEGNIDVFVSCVGSGGTITGTGRFLKEKNPSIRIIAVEPAESAVLSGGKAGPHKIQGIGAGFVPKALDTGIYDEIITVKGDDAYHVARDLALREGILVGISSGAAVWASAEMASKPEYKNKTIVTIIPDSGERYLSTGLFNG